MKVKVALKISQLMGRTIPCDIPEQLSQKYLSESRGEYIPIGEMDLIHFIRAFKDKNTKMLFEILGGMNPKDLN